MGFGVFCAALCGKDSPHEKHHTMQFGGPHGEIGASLRYLSQRYSMPYPELRAILTDVGNEASPCGTRE